MNFLVNFAKFRRTPIFIRTPLEAASEQTTKNHDKNKIMCGSCQSTKQIEKKPASLNVWRTQDDSVQNRFLNFLKLS